MVWTVDSTSVHTDSTAAKVDGASGGGTGAALAGAATDAVSAAGALINFASVVLTAPLYTGVGGIFDPNLVWPFSAPVVGSQVYFDSTKITVLTNGEINAVANSGMAEIQYNDGTHVNEIDVFITAGLVGYASDTTSASGSLGGGSALAAAASTLITAVGALTTGINLAGAAATLTTTVGALTAAIQLAGAASDASTATGAFAAAPPAALVGAASDATTASAALTTQLAIAAAAADVVSATGALTTQLLFAAQATDTTSAAGSINTNVLMIGSAGDVTGAAGLLGSIQMLFGAANDVTAAAGALMTQITMAASASSATLASASLSTAIQMAAAAQDVDSGAGALGVLPLIAYPNRVLRTTYMPQGLGAQAGVLPYGEFFAAVDDEVIYGIDWDGWLANYRQPGAFVPPGTAIRPRAPNGYAFSTVNGGQSGNLEPVWPNIIGQTVTDGSITWVCEAIDTTSLSATVQSVAWRVPAGIAVDGQETTGQTVLAMLDTSGATAGQNYTINVATLMSDRETKVGRIVLKVR